MVVVKLSIAIILVTGSALAQSVAFEISERDLIPEGITYDPVHKAFLISSIFKNKIVRVSKTGSTDFIKNNEAEFVGGVGLEVDRKRNVLWACTGNVMGSTFRTGIFAYDLSTGQLLKKVFYPTDTVQRLFNDLAVTADGTIYITDTFKHCVWRWNLSMEAPDKVEIKTPIRYPNGITLSPNENVLYIASDAGLVYTDLTTNNSGIVKMPKGEIGSTGLDGIKYYKNSIVAVQNGVRDKAQAKVVRYYIGKDPTKIESIEVIDIGNKHFDIPTTLAIEKNELYVLANSQIDNLDQENLKIVDPEKLKNIIILKYKLK